MAKYLLKDVKPNPFRRDKIEALRESMRSTTYWDNILARIGEDSKTEIAFGHHRLVALEEEYRPETIAEAKSCAAGAAGGCYKDAPSLVG